MKLFSELRIASIFLLSLFFSCNCTPIPQPDGLVPRLEPVSFPILARSTPLSKQDDPKIPSHNREDQEEAPNPPPNQRRPLPWDRREPPSGTGPTQSRRPKREPALNKEEQGTAGKALLQPVQSSWIDKELPWNKNPGEKGSWTNVQIKEVIAYIYFYRYSVKRKLQPHKRDEMAEKYGSDSSPLKAQEEKKRLQTVTDRNQLIAEINRLWPWLKDRRAVVSTIKSVSLSGTTRQRCHRIPNKKCGTIDSETMDTDHEEEEEEAA